MTVLSGGKKRSGSCTFVQTNNTHRGKFRLTPTPFVLILSPSWGKKKRQKKINKTYDSLHACKDSEIKDGINDFTY